VAMVAMDYLGFLGEFDQRVKNPRLLYLLLLLFPALMARSHFLNKLKPPDTEGHGGFMGLPAVGPAAELKSFTMSDPTISTEGIAREDDAWRITSSGREERIRLFEVPDPGVEECMLIYRAQLKTEGVGRRAYLEMWCRFSRRREFFSKGFAFHGPVTGTSDWAVYETPFYLRRGQKPNLVKLNLVVEGGGTVWVKDVQLLLAPLKQGQQVTGA